MKKIVSLLLLLSIAFSLVSCGEPVKANEKTVPTVSDEIIGVANVAPQGFVLCGSAVKGSNIFANDGDLSTYYCSNVLRYPDDGEYMFIDLTEPYTVRSVVLREAKDAEKPFPTDVTVSVSDDGKKWNEIKSFNGISDGDELTLDGVVTRYLRVAPADKLQGFAVSEFEVNADIDAKHNLVLNFDDVWLYGRESFTLSEKSVRVGESGKSLEFFSSDPSVADVGFDGNIYSHGTGECSIFAYDGKNLSECKVTVFDDSEEHIRITTYFITSFMNPMKIAESMDYAKDLGMDFLENTGCFDDADNRSGPYCVFLAAERGMLYQICDDINGTAMINASDEELEAIIAKYEHKAGFGGLQLKDEPWEGLTHYEELIARVNDISSDVTVGFNILPVYEHVLDYARVLRYTDGKQYVSTDTYPYGRWLEYEDAGDTQLGRDDYYSHALFKSWCYTMYDALCKSELLYETKSAIYLQAFGFLENAAVKYRCPEDYEIIYNAYLALSYHILNFKWFILNTPNWRNKEGFETGILSPDYTPSRIYDAVKQANVITKDYDRYLADTRVIETAFSPKFAGGTSLPESFVIRQADDELTFIYSHYLGRTGEFFSVLRDPATEGERDSVFEISNGAENVWHYLGDGKWEKIAVTDGKITVKTDRSSFALFTFDEKYTK